MMRAKNTGRCTSCAAVPIISMKCFLSPPIFRMPQNVFDHHHRAIHNHAEIECSKREQVRGNMTQVQQNCGKEQSERNRDGHNQSAADIAQEQKRISVTSRTPSVKLRSTVRVV